jgi:hypothetical protein
MLAMTHGAGTAQHWQRACHFCMCDRTAANVQLGSPKYYRYVLVFLQISLHGLTIDNQLNLQTIASSMSSTTSSTRES